MLRLLVLGTSFVFSFIIGIILLFFGCNPDADHLCVAYHIVEATVSGYKFVSTTCSTCVSQDAENNCTGYDYYDCYYSYLRMVYGSNNTCWYETASGSTSQASAKNSATKHPIGEEKTLLRNKGSSTCTNLSSGMNLWIAGVAFLSLCALLSIFLIVLYFTKYYPRYRRNADTKHVVIIEEEIEVEAVELEQIKAEA